jgi:hypothetical protein
MENRAWAETNLNPDLACHLEPNAEIVVQDEPLGKLLSGCVKRGVRPEGLEAASTLACSCQSSIERKRFWWSYYDLPEIGMLWVQEVIPFVGYDG